MANFDNNRNYGIEIEFSWNGRCPSYSAIAAAITNAGVPCEAQSLRHDAPPTWKIVSDGSVSNGGEIVSPILNGLDGKEQLRTVLRVIKEMGAKTDRSCGIHVHHDAGDMNPKHLANVAELYRAYEPVIDQFVSPSRRDNAYCRPMASFNFFENASTRQFSHIVNRESLMINDRLDHANANAMINAIQGFRYHKVNLTAYLRHGTVEFRQHQSSLNVNKIWSWVVFTQTIMTVAKAKRGKVVGRTVNTGPENTRSVRALLREMGMRKARNYDDTTLDAFKRLMKRLPRRMRVNMRNGDPVNDNTDGIEGGDPDAAQTRVGNVNDDCTRNDCTGTMVRRTNNNTGEAFLGCSNFRRGCRNSRPIAA